MVLVNGMMVKLIWLIPLLLVRIKCSNGFADEQVGVAS